MAEGIWFYELLFVDLMVISGYILHSVSATYDICVSCLSFIPCDNLKGMSEEKWFQSYSKY